jgi:hypothetical protein
MKCIYCQSDSKYKTRQSNRGRCGACHHAFAFEPYTDPLKIADGLFLRAIKDVSSLDSLFFTERQLWYELNRRLWRRQVWTLTPGWGAATACCGIGGFITAVALGSFWPILIAVPGVATGVMMSRRRRRNGPRTPPMSFDTFSSSYLSRWVHAHGPIERLLPSPVPRPDLQARGAEPDLTAYSFDRALVTDGDETAAMLVANNFHFENNCAVLSTGGYPGAIAETVLAMLRRNPQLKLFALHDASPTGCRLPLILREERWFPDTSIQILDLGLRPRHIQSLKLFILKSAPVALPPEVRALLTPEEAAWLEQGQTAELEALRPARLMKAVYQGFARAGQPGAEYGSGADGGFIWIGDGGGADVYAADSFG